jgi:hypothetical protein
MAQAVAALSDTDTAAVSIYAGNERQRSCGRMNARFS